MMKPIEKLMFFAAGVALTVFIAPIFERARANAVRSSCQSNLKQIGNSFSQYVRDYDEQFPLKNNWQSALQPYGKFVSEVWRCPNQQFNYVYNDHLAEIRDAQIEKHGQIAMVYEGATARRFDEGQSWFPFAHLGGSNVLYMDFHVKWETKAPLFFSPEMANPRAWSQRQQQKEEAQIKAYWRKYPKTQRPLKYR